MSSTPARWAEIRAKLEQHETRRARAAVGLEHSVHRREVLEVLEDTLRRYCELRRITVASTQARERYAPGIYDFADWFFRESGLYLAGAARDVEFLLGECERLANAGAGRFPVKDAGPGETVPWWAGALACEQLGGAYSSPARVAANGGLSPVELDVGFPAWRRADELLEGLCEAERERARSSS